MNRRCASDPEGAVDTLDARALVVFCQRARIGLWVMIASLGVFMPPHRETARHLDGRHRRGR